LNKLGYRNNLVNISKNTMKLKSSTSAFTLIELSIVLMIISIIIIGVIGGTRLIKNAKISKLISETGDYTQQFNAFYDRYEAYPGDFAGTAAAFGTIDVNGKTINPGDGDGLIGGDTFAGETESSGFFHHLYLSGIVTNPEFTGVVPTDTDGVVINSNFPGTPFGSKSFFYAASSAVDGRYTRSNRIVLATKGETGSSINSMTPNDAESLDIKKDDGNPFKGNVIAHNAELASASNENDSTCTDINGYNTDLTGPGCILETNLDNKDSKFDSNFLSNNPGFGDNADSGATFDPGTGNATDDSNTNCRLSSPSAYSHVASWNTYSGGDIIATGTTVTGNCATGYTLSTPTITITCTNGTWGTQVGQCVSTSSCQVPEAGSTGYETVASWNTYTEGQYVDDNTTVTGNCASAYDGTFSTTCHNGTFGTPSSRCTACHEFTYTNGSQTFTVPDGITSVKLQVWGAQGGSGYYNNVFYNVGGKGGYAVGSLPVTSGSSLYVYVGGKGGEEAVNNRSTFYNEGGYNGGARGECYVSGSQCIFGDEPGGGGGASDIRYGGTDLTDRKIVGGGGGGSCGYAGGAGGGNSGGNCSTGVQGGQGGTQSAGGAGGYDDTFGGGIVNYGEPGTIGIGGRGRGNLYANGGSGGGGGYYGGGGAVSSYYGAGGGSGYIGGVSGGDWASGVKSGNGFARICWGGNDCDNGSGSYSDTECPNN
jgi:prepilin-type N-terminal cleavage/methylation domain-containing protein